MSVVHIAICLKDPNWAPIDIINHIRNWNIRPGVKEGKPVTHPDNLLAASSVEEIKERIKSKLAINPEERWVIFSANTMAETVDPYRFRSI
jgi:hypothetical protein